MILRIVGASCILVVCGGFGFMMAARHLREERALRQLVELLDYMESELLYRLPALPELCREAVKNLDSPISPVFQCLAQELENQIAPDVDRCMTVALNGFQNLPAMTRSALIQLGKQLGRFDLQGQLKGLENVRQTCRHSLKELEINKDARLRGYRTLGLCTGAALVILFI